MNSSLRVQSECDACVSGKASRAAGTTCPFTERGYERGETLCREGAPADTVWFVKRGTVVLARGSGDEAGAARARGVRTSGSFVALEALVHPRYLGSARTSEASVICAAPVARVDAWLGATDQPARVALEQHLRAETAEPGHAASPDGTAVARVARWVLAEVGTGQSQKLLRRDVAGLLGMVAETFSRALAELTRRGAISTTRQQVRIVDDQALRRAAGSSA